MVAAAELHPGPWQQPGNKNIGVVIEQNEENFFLKIRKLLSNLQWRNIGKRKKNEGKIFFFQEYRNSVRVRVSEPADQFLYFSPIQGRTPLKPCFTGL